MNTKHFERVWKLTAVQFNPDEHPWHHSIQRDSYDGKFHEPPSYSCIIPCEKIVHIRPGDWIIVDSMSNAQGVIGAYELERPEFYGLRVLD